ncbi:MAG TPA: hypothetical protein VNL98_05195, partial [Gemmatimonadales bacterium]|nr:hypothetical protein [Gemmatimonadales bacterium]
GGHANVIHVPSAQKMDLYLIGDDELHAWAMQHRRRERIAGNDVWLAPAEYVVIRKLERVRMGGSSRHLRDVRDILVHAGPALDPAALRAMVASRGLEAALEAARNTPD